jgi:hypothetical protein
MWSPFRVFRPENGNDKHLDQIREVVARSYKLLSSNPAPDTFAGRKTQEPFPEEPQIVSWLNSKELEPPK